MKYNKCKQDLSSTRSSCQHVPLKIKTNTTFLNTSLPHSVCLTRKKNHEVLRLQHITFTVEATPNIFVQFMIKKVGKHFRMQPQTSDRPLPFFLHWCVLAEIPEQNTMFPPLPACWPMKAQSKEGCDPPSALIGRLNGWSNKNRMGELLCWASTECSNSSAQTSSFPQYNPTRVQ